MPECPNCHQYYFGELDECPKCHKKLIMPIQAATRSKNIGNAVQILAYMDLAINAIATIVCAIVFGRDRWGDFQFRSFLLILLAGLVVSAIAFIMLYAYGRLVESSIQTAENTEASRKCLEQIVQQNHSASK